MLDEILRLDDPDALLFELTPLELEQIAHAKSGEIKTRYEVGDVGREGIDQILQLTVLDLIARRLLVIALDAVSGLRIDPALALRKIISGRQDRYVAISHGSVAFVHPMLQILRNVRRAHALNLHVTEVLHQLRVMTLDCLFVLSPGAIAALPFSIAGKALQES